MTDRQSYRRMQEIFLHASALAQSERLAYLDEACHDDSEMRAEVEAMLAADREAGAFLEGPPVVLEPSDHRPASASEPVEIGPFRLLRRLGSGGMGVVYLAEQTAPVRRQVALKLIRTGMDSEQVVARFELERQALAMMEHPGIARVLDAGATDNGRPYFVMEVVHGTPITRFCNDNRLTIEQRLELFARVCDALQHAHQKGIIHRDIKPSNVLVESRDGVATPKIIDFGIAKATGQGFADGSQATVMGQLLGTLEYMSPEQAEMSSGGIDTRSDIYSMGVMLYRLLSGALPVDPEILRSAGFTGVRRVLLEEDPPRPSTRVSSNDESEIACGIDVRSLSRILRGDLDWIVMKAIDKDIGQRYQTASELAADIRRYLANEPVLASPPGATYRLRKFVRRHRTAVAGLIGGVVLLLGGVVATTSQAIRATRAEREAHTQAALAADVNQFLVSMLAEADPANHPAGHEATVVEAVETAARMVDTGDRSPRLEAEVRRVVGEVFLALSRHDEAERQTREAVRLLQGLDQVDETEVARLQVKLGVILIERGESERARRVLGEARDTFAGAGPAHVLDWAEATRHLADVAKVGGDFEGAAELYEAVLRAARTIDSEKATILEATALIRLGALDLEAMQLERAESRVREGLAVQRSVFGESHPFVADTLRQLAMVLSEKGDLEQADRLFRASLDTTRSIYGEGHVRVAVSLQNFGRHLLRSNPEMAEPYLHEAVEVLEDLDNGAGLAQALDILAAVELDLGRFDEAETSFSRALELRRECLPDDHPDIALSLNNLGSVLMRTGRFESAEPLFEQALRRFRRAYGDRHPRVVAATYNLGSTQSDAGRPAEALVNLKAAAELAVEVFPEGHLSIAIMQAKLGECLGRLSRFAEAETLLVPARDRIRTLLGEQHWRSRQADEMVAQLHARWEKAD